MPSFWRRRAITLSLAALAIAAISFDRLTHQAPSTDDWQQYHDAMFRVVRVIDGDTLDIAAPDGDHLTTRVRLWGVDSPELARNEYPAMHFAEQAREFAVNTLQDSQVHIVLSPKRSRGKYGRLLAYVYLTKKGSMFNEMLIEEGYAFADLRFKHHYYDRFKGIEKAAHHAARGMWAEMAIDKMPHWRQRFEKKKN